MASVTTLITNQSLTCGVERGIMIVWILWRIANSMSMAGGVSSGQSLGSMFTRIAKRAAAYVICSRYNDPEE